MVRNLTRNLICFLAALVLLTLLLCAVEISFRVHRLRASLASEISVSELEELIAPSGMSWIEVKPLIDLQRKVNNTGYVRIQTNEHGIRGRSVSLPKPRGTYRILCLGGDNVFGSDSVSPETLPSQLQRLLNLQSSLPVEVINAGCPNAGPLINLLRYRAHLSSLQPDLVILCLSEEDLSYDHDVRGALHLDEGKQPAYASHPALNGQGSAVLDGMCKEFVTMNWLLSWAGDLAGMRSGMTRINTAPVRGSIQRDLAAIAPLSTLVQGNFGHLIVSTTPSAWSVDRARNAIDKNQSSFAEDVRRFLKGAHLEGQIEVQDGLTAFSQIPNLQACFQPESGRLSSNGNVIYAQQLANFLLQSVPGLAGAPAPAGPPSRLPSAIAPGQEQFIPLQQGDRSPATVIR